MHLWEGGPRRLVCGGPEAVSIRAAQILDLSDVNDARVCVIVNKETLVYDYDWVRDRRVRGDQLNPRATLQAWSVSQTRRRRMIPFPIRGLRSWVDSELVGSVSSS